MAQVTKSDVGGKWTLEVYEGNGSGWTEAPGDARGWTLRGARKAAESLRDMLVSDGYARESIRVRARNAKTDRKVEL